MPFSLLDLERTAFHAPYLINVAPLPCEIWNTENAYEHKL